MIKQLRLKFVAINMAIVTAVLLVMFSFLYISTRQDLEQQSIQMLQSVMPMMENQNRHDIGQRPQRGRDILLPYFTVEEQNGILTASGNGVYNLEDEDLLSNLMEAVNTDGKQIGVLSDYGLRYCIRSSPMGSFTVFADMSSEEATLSGLLKTCALVGGISFAAFLAISFLLANWAVKPVEQAWNQQRQFVADASHELKTPLTVITTNAELCKAPDSTEAERGRYMDSILAMSAQMRGLVEGLLELARVDNGTAKMTFEPFNFSELTEDALLPFEPVFFEKGLLLDSEIQEDIHVKGSCQHLKQVIDILLDNAQKYAADGAQVKVTLNQQEKNRCLLTVANQGDPIAPEDLKNIFRRFYRVDKARSMNHSYGLGLSIAQTIVEEHGGRIWAESRDGWNRFLVRLNLE